MGYGRALKSVALGLLIAASTPARASCPVIAGAEGGALAAKDDEARLAWIRARLARTSHRATVWLRGWELGIAGATVVDLAMIPILGDTRDNRIDFGLGAITTIIGIPPLMLWPPRVLADHEALEALAATPGAERCAVLADAEKRLAADAAAQDAQRAWYMHAGNVVLNAGVTLLFGAFHHWTSGVLNGIGGAIVGEVIIFTEPIDQLDDLASYRRGDFVAPVRPAWQLVPTFSRGGMGLALAIDL